MVDFVVSVILVVIVGSALLYIIKAKKNGIQCVGCPDGANCRAHRQNAEATSTCGCGSDCSACSGCHANVK